MAKKPSRTRKTRTEGFGLASQILRTIRSEIVRQQELVASDYYAKQANPKDGGYAKCNYVKGDRQRMVFTDPSQPIEQLQVRMRPNRVAPALGVERATRARRSAERKPQVPGSTSHKR